jgi:hypothetical protein
MAEKSVFISSCSRRQLARRRPDRAARRYQLQLIVLLIVVLAAGVFLIGRGTF